MIFLKTTLRDLELNCVETRKDWPALAGKPDDTEITVQTVDGSSWFICEGNKVAVGHSFDAGELGVLVCEGCDEKGFHSEMGWWGRSEDDPNGYYLCGECYRYARRS